jgi:hypothetical protein
LVAQAFSPNATLFSRKWEFSAGVGQVVNLRRVGNPPKRG